MVPRRAAQLLRQLIDQGYEVDGEMQVRHGYVIDIVFPEDETNA